MDGILIVDKPAGLTSHDVVAHVRRILGVRRVGHTGTLDPFATGVLVVMVGRATRLAQYLSGADKEYEATIRFGYATDTGDSTGEPRRQETSPCAGRSVEEREAVWSGEEIEAALASLRGATRQVPPMYSAKKVRGQKLYEMARRGEQIERAAVPIFVREFEAVRHEGGELLRKNADKTSDLRVRVVCSAGTYVRVLAESVGEGLNAGAHLAALRRTRAGDFGLKEAKSLNDIAERIAAGAPPANLLLPPEAALSRMPFVHLTAEQAGRARHGMAVRAGAAAEEGRWGDGQLVRLSNEGGRLIAVGIYDAETESLRPRVVIAVGE